MVTNKIWEYYEYEHSDKRSTRRRTILMAASRTNGFYNTLAKTGDNITSLGNLTGFGDSPSINDLGLIAFVGRANNNTDLLVENNLGHITNLSIAYPNSFSQAVQINNQNKVVARTALVGFQEFDSGILTIRILLK